MSIKVWADSPDDPVGIGFCLHCQHASGGHYDTCRFHRNNLHRVRYYSDKAFIVYLGGALAADGKTRLNLKYVFAYEGNVTDKKRLEWGARAFQVFMEKMGNAGGQKAWDEAGDAERLRWVNMRGGRYSKVEVVVDFTYEDITINHDHGSMGSPFGQVWYDNFKLKEGS
jgi:hypothetical protein